MFKNVNFIYNKLVLMHLPFVEQYLLRVYYCYSGVSPFLDDSLEETTANILKCDFCFPDEYFNDISNEGKDLIGRLLVATSSQRMTAQECLDSPWFKDVRHCD
jgi:serine/threonine protein kinase